jgi:hypothetical protein
MFLVEISVGYKKCTGFSLKIFNAAFRSEFSFVHNETVDSAIHQKYSVHDVFNFK